MLTEVQISCAKDFVTGTLSINAIAKKNEVSRTTLWEWRQNAEFKALMDSYAIEIQDMTKTELRLNSNKYLQLLNKLAESKNERIRLDALKTLMEMAELTPKSSPKIEFNMSKIKEPERLTLAEIERLEKELYTE
jgi:transposase-like protein